MDIRVKSDFKMNAEVSEYLSAKLASLEKHMGSAEGGRCEVELSRVAGKKHRSDHMWTAEVRVMILGMKAAYAKNSAASVNAALDDVKDEIERQLRQNKGKNNDTHRRAEKKFKDSIRRGA